MGDNSKGLTDADRTRIHQVEELTRDSVRAVAERIDRATTFEDFIYRESEIDALWSLADIAARNAALAAHPEQERWVQLRKRLGQAHDLVAEGEAARSAAALRTALELL